jgi:hypothetical protein
MFDFDDYDTVFVPGAPMELSHFLVGRDSQLLDLQRYITRPGLHPVVIGDRGVGKTSLVRQAFCDSTLRTVFITCNSQITFSGLARAILRQLGKDTDTLERTSNKERSVEVKGSPFGVGLGHTRKRSGTVRRAELGAGEIDPWRLYEELRDFPEKVLIVLDEYDAVHRAETDVHAGVAELIKTLADNRTTCDSRIVLVGIASRAAEWMGDHPSIHRSAREVHVAPLTDDDIRLFLTRAEENLHFTFKPTVRDAVVDNALGYPYYVHLLGLECIDTMLSRDNTARVVEENDYQQAMKKAVSRAFRSELQKYREALRGLSPRASAVIKQLVAYSRFAKAPRSILEQRLAEEERISLAEAEGVVDGLLRSSGLLYFAPNKGEVRFREPLMAPFIRSYIFPFPHLHGIRVDPAQLSLL